MATATPDPAPDDGGRDEIRTVTVHRDGDRRLAYAEYGRPDGTPAVFLHGTPGSRRSGELLDAAARESGVRLLAIDRPGYGRSEPWPDRSVRDAGAFVTAVLDDAGIETAGIVAFSGGAPHALAAAAAHPDRIPRVDLVSGATPPEASERTPTVQRLLSEMATKIPSVLQGLFRVQAWVAARADPSFVVGQYAASEEPIPDDAAAVVKADLVEAFAGRGGGAVTELRLTAADWGIDYDDLDTAVGVWHGENDTNVPVEGARRLASRIPTARLAVLDDADHLGTLLQCAPDVLDAHGRGA
ncbi:alpha/beta hydrolase [Halostella sp. JP-L12]|uniref:alpha/beta fold hydrolase n=1 Tax=Halostella TaxID=1843185 RepID=UPI000EF7F30E|nr:MULTISPECIES: alpha/beta hydrolase [Halostella]NHN49677.1 alpha/beta hydrolase [Halostella sp. JP-L12]